MKSAALHHKLILTLSASCMLTGCSVAPSALAFKDQAVDFIMGEDVNMTEKSYAAADYLVQQARSYIKGYQLIKIEPILNLESPELSSQLDKAIPERVGARFAQLGYRTDMSAVVHEADTGYSQTPDQYEKPHFVLTGTYMRDSNNYNISLRIVQTKDRRVIAAFDYALPRNYELRQLSKPEPRIFKIEQK